MVFLVFKLLNTQCKEMMKTKYLSYGLEAIILKLSMLQPNYRITHVQLPNCYTDTQSKFERVLPVLYRDIHHFINAIYYS